MSALQWLPSSVWLTPEIQPRLESVWRRPELSCLLEVLGENGIEVLLVGGAVRDLLLGRDVKDFDLLATCTAPQAVAMIPTLSKRAGVTVIPLDRKRGILRVCYRESEGVDVTALLEPSIYADLRRRDLTVNAMAIRPDGHLADPFGGRQDLQQRFVRALGPDVLPADPLRVLRCLRVAAVLNFQIEPTTLQWMTDASSGLERVAGERIGEELLRFLAHTDATLLEHFRETRIAQAVWQIGCDEVPWDWLQQWCAQHPLRDRQPRSPDQTLSLLAALLWRAARDPSRGDSLLERIKLSRSQTKYVRQWWSGCAVLQGNHPTTSRSVFSLVRTAGPSLEGTLDFATLGCFPHPVPAELEQRLRKALSGRGELRLDPLPLGGEELCRHWNREPGRWLGPVLAELEAAWACREHSEPEALLAYSASFL